MTERYLDPFISEMRGYCAAIDSLAVLLCDQQSGAQAIGETAQELARLFHTIAGLSGSLEVSDLARLAEGLEDSCASLAAHPEDAQATSSAPALADALALTNRYLNRRLDSMEASGQFTEPASDDQEPLHALDEFLRQPEGQPALADKDTLPPAAGMLTDEDLAILRAFSASDLAGAPAAPATQTTSLADAAAAAADGRQSGAETPAAEEVSAPELPAEEEIPPEMLELFQVETQEDAQAFQAALAHLESPENRTAAILDMRHIAHKIKGAAATLNLHVIASLAHCLEDILDLLRSRRLHYVPAVLDTLMHGLTELEVALQRHTSGEPESPEGLERLRAAYEALLAVTAAGEDDPDATQPHSVRLAAAAHQQAAENVAESSHHDFNLTSLDALRERSWAPGREHSLRVEVSRLDQLMGLVGELATNRATTDQARREINESLAEVRRIIQGMSQVINRLDEEEAKTENHATAAPAPPIGMTPDITSQQATARTSLGLERFDSEHSHLIRTLREGVNDVSSLSDGLQRLLLRLNGLSEAQDTLTTTIQRDITKLRLIPIGQMLPRLQLTVRMVAQEQNKQINFQASGEATEIDRDIIESISGPLDQLVRNCAAHGIEPADERREQGKPEVGTISLHAYYSGNEVSIEVSDDGRGINYHQLIAAALASGKLSPEEADRLTPEQAANLMLLPDISTSPEVTTIAGRGVGMDMVRATVENLKGTLHIHSKPGEGTTFHLRLPISLGILRALFVRVGQQHYAIPLSSVERIAHQDQQDSGHLPYVALADLLGIPPSADLPVGTSPAGQTALIVALGHRQMGVFVDEVLTEREIVIKRLPPYLRRRGVRGVTLGLTGEMLLLLDLPELAHHALSDAPGAQAAAASAAPPAISERSADNATVLVVDDSLFMRRTLEAQLTRAGYRATSAKDGMEALHQILQHRPGMVLLDIEMPQLDGYELLGILRRQEQFKALPIAILTSRAADKHREHAQELGASAYLVKPCPQDVLLQTVARLLGR